MQSLCLLLPPVFFAASIYMTLGRLISSVRGEAFAVLPPQWNTKTFVIGDCLSFLMQGSGGSCPLRMIHEEQLTLLQVVVSLQKATQ